MRYAIHNALVIDVCVVLMLVFAYTMYQGVLLTSVDAWSGVAMIVISLAGAVAAAVVLKCSLHKSEEKQSGNS